MSEIGNNPESSSNADESRMDEEALDWLIKLDGKVTPGEQDEFFQWLAANPRHGEWFAFHQRTYNQFDSLVQWRPEHSERPNPDLLAVPWSKRPWFLALSSLSVAAILCMGLLIWQPWVANQQYEGYLPQNGVMAQEYQIHRLQDGSIVELNKGAQIGIDYTKGERLIDLLSGEAYFEVARDVDRPFVVRARGINVKAVGTAFNVRLEEDSLEVMVTHGRVLMDSSVLVKRKDIHDQAEPEVVHPELRAGQRSLVSFGSESVVPLVDEISEEEFEEELAWKHQVLEFVEKPLSEIVAEFNHYNTRQVSIEDQEIMDLQITATFRSYNLDGFVRLLELTGPVKAKVNPDESIVLERDSSH